MNTELDTQAKCVASFSRINQNYYKLISIIYTKNKLNYLQLNEYENNSNNLK